LHLVSREDLTKLYEVERKLSYALQQATQLRWGDAVPIVEKARNDLRDIMRKLGWKRKF